jgi:hypothetical protein
MARAAVDGAVFGAGGLSPVTKMTAAISRTQARELAQDERRALLVPFSALRIKMKAVRGEGSSQIPSPISRRSTTTPRNSA